jgi:hypothetical protein
VKARPVGRFYAAHRRAWTPSLWPPVVIAGVIAFAFAALAHPSPPVDVAFGVVVGFTGSWLRWAIWRRRHPIIPIDQYVTDLIRDRQRKARWN